MTTALIFDVQRFSVHDGPGIRTTVFFKGCPLKCRWCQNPEALRPDSELAFDAGHCRDSAGCFAACPRDALQPGPERILRARCDACGLCQSACAFGALRVVGQRVPIHELAELLERDRPSFEASGGGVTLSGGEPTQQMEAMGALARECRSRGLTVGLQTCGLFRWESFAPHSESLDFVYFDLKAIDPVEHERQTGADNRRILENARRLQEAGAPVRFRVPIVPGCTDSEANLRATARFLGGLGVRSVTLLEYHRLGLLKLPRVGFPIPAMDAGGPEVAAASLDRAARVMRAAGLEVNS